MVAAAAAVLIGACSNGGGDAGGPPPGAGPTDGAAPVYLAIGSDETVGVGLDRPTVEAWPQVLYRTALPRETVFVNGATPGTSVADALAEQLPLARELEPTLVTVWLGRVEFNATVPAATFERQLSELVRALRRGGRTEVLVANLPPGGLFVRVPVDSAGPEALDDDILAGSIPPEHTARIQAYNDAIDRVARAEGARVVDLHGAAVAAEDGSPEATLASPIGRITPAGYAHVAELFADAL